MRRLAGDRLPFCWRRVTCAYLGANFNIAAIIHSQRGADPGKRLLEVLMDIIAERFERRDIEHTCFVLEVSSETITKQLIKRSQKSGQGLPRTGRRSNERVGTRLDGRPTLFLR